MQTQTEAALPRASFQRQKAAPVHAGGRVLQVFLHSDMRCGHEGLAILAKEAGIDVTKLAHGQYVVFVNSASDKIKLYATSHVVAYMQLPKGQKFDLRVISEIPKAFNGSGKLDYDKALKGAVEGALQRLSEAKGAV